MFNEAEIETQKRPGSERVQTDSMCYPANERAYQGGSGSDPKGIGAALVEHGVRP